MNRILPLIKRIEIALTTASSNSEMNDVYSKLSDFLDNDSNLENFRIFYRKLNSQTLSPISRNSLNHDSVVRGKQIYSYLQERLSIPNNKDINNQRRMKEFRNKEYNIIMEMVENE